MDTKIKIEKKDITKRVENLTTVLANQIVLYVKTRKFHWNVSGNWNVSGKSFMPFHKLFESHYKSIELTIDEITKRISKLGGSIGSQSEFLNHSILKENTEHETQEKMLIELLNDHERIITNLRNMIADMERDYDDFGTAAFLTVILEGHESKALALSECIYE